MKREEFRDGMITFIPEITVIRSRANINVIWSEYFSVLLHGYKYTRNNHGFFPAFGVAEIVLNNATMQALGTTAEKLTYEEAIQLADYPRWITVAKLQNGLLAPKPGAKRWPDSLRECDPGILEQMAEVGMDIPEGTDGWYTFSKVQNDLKRQTVIPIVEVLPQEA